jgi:Mrp family chromosome partitioning ATPase
MERLQIAIEKARAQRNKAARAPADAAPAAGPATQAATAAPESVWTALRPIEARRALLDRNRVIAFSGGPEAAPYDLLRTRILQQARLNNWRRIAVVSPHSASGKTTTTANLAFSFGRQKDIRTMVFDFDLRRPALARVLGQTCQHNMADVLEERIGFAEHGMRYGDNLALGLNHEAAKNSSELLQSQQTVEILAAIEAAYRPDICLFDMPPMLASDDTFGFLKNVDCALLIAEAEKTSMIQIDVAERQLAELTNVIGVVLNKCNYADGLYGYDAGYY